MGVKSTVGSDNRFTSLFCGLCIDFVEINILFQQYPMNGCDIYSAMKKDLSQNLSIFKFRAVREPPTTDRRRRLVSRPTSSVLCPVLYSNPAMCYYRSIKRGRALC